MRIVPLLLVLVLVAGCGYRNPNVYSGPSKVVALKEWKNRTSQLTLDAKIYRSLTNWFQYSSSITTVRDREGADLILVGEIVSIELPSLSYGAGNIANEVKVRLRVRYLLKEIATNRVLLEAPDETWIEEYLLTADSTANRDNETDALDSIVDDLSKKIYQRTVAILPTL